MQFQAEIFLSLEMTLFPKGRSQHQFLALICTVEKRSGDRNRGSNYHEIMNMVEHFVSLLKLQSYSFVGSYEGFLYRIESSIGRRTNVNAPSPGTKGMK